MIEKVERRPEGRRWWVNSDPEHYDTLKYNIAAEPLLDTIYYEEQAVGIVTRNRYEAKVLNTPHLLIADVDLHDDQHRCLNGAIFDAVLRAANLYGQEFDLVEMIRCRLTDRYLSWRIYYTRNGLRLLETTRNWSRVDEEEIYETLKSVYTDPDYIRICLNQKLFRARLTPKPWRGEYGRACAFCEVVGSGRIDPMLEPLVKYHDRISQAHDRETYLA
jgi:hypothetical protein